MLRSQLHRQVCRQSQRWSCPAVACQQTPQPPTTILTRCLGGVPEEDMPYLHHQKFLQNNQNAREKFKSPQRRASKLLHEISQEYVEHSRQNKDAVFGVDYQVGDAIECQIIEQGGTNSTELKKVRGLVIAKFNKGIDSSVLIRDVVMGSIVERRIPLHSPLLKSIKLLEKNFIYKGKRKVKRAKLYFLRERNPNESRVTKSKN
ncbi:protein L19 [Seminavis robusta]|uniref:50S ribosomal protein L19, chloroplastic n=1 Tax=Seminavis robusta TaxID=568900 RepID=A0A9N8H484_9STRA|nr:protein L19 [Seminavis robusta]|eukprot:Sro79_g042660.1 protein L19 (204) ;mRNA; r:27664-28366